MSAPDQTIPDQTIPDQTIPDRTYWPALVLLAALVMLWGIGHRFYEMLMPQFADVFSLRGARLSLTEGAYQVVYVLGAIPAALAARLFGFRTALQLGLGLICIGGFTFYPATQTQGFAYFLLAVMLLASGWIVLEVAANTLILRFGAPETAVRRLNLLQAAYPIGSLIGIFVGQWIVSADLALPREHLRYSLAHPYIALALGVLIFAYLLEEFRFPAFARERMRHLSGAGSEIAYLFRDRCFVFALAAQFANILALGTAWSLSDRLFHLGFGEFAHHTPGDLLLWCIVLFALGRFAAVGLMWLMRAEHVLELFSVCGVLAAIIALFSIALLDDAALAAFASLALCFFLAPAWPTIFGLGVEGLGSRSKLGAGLIAMAGALGAVLYHFLDAVPPHWVMLVPALCSAVMVGYGFAAGREKTAPGE